MPADGLCYTANDCDITTRPRDKDVGNIDSTLRPAKFSQEVSSIGTSPEDAGLMEVNAPAFLNSLRTVNQR